MSIRSHYFPCNLLGPKETASCHANGNPSNAFLQDILDLSIDTDVNKDTLPQRHLILSKQNIQQTRA